jgi:hypothetical protein
MKFVHKLHDPATHPWKTFLWPHLLPGEDSLSLVGCF